MAQIALFYQTQLLHHAVGFVLSSVRPPTWPRDDTLPCTLKVSFQERRDSHPTFILSAWHETWLRPTSAYSSSVCTEKIGDAISFGHVDKKRDRLCYILGFSLCFHPRIFSLVNLADMNIKDSLKGQLVGCIQRWIGILALNLQNQTVEMSPVIPPLYAQVPAAEALIVAPLEEVFVYHLGCSSTAPCKGKQE